jgi:hypothetical protein
MKTLQLIIGATVAVAVVVLSWALPVMDAIETARVMQHAPVAWVLVLTDP